MADPTSSLTKHVTPIEAGAHVTAAAFLGGVPALALGDGRVVLAEGGVPRHVDVHPDGAILVAESAGGVLVTGGDDGRVVRVRADGSCDELANAKGAWIDALAARPDGTITWATGKSVFARDPKGAIKVLNAPSSVRGLAFAPKGYRIALAHYKGASLWFPNTAAAPDAFEWNGSHLDVTMSPDGRFLVTTMQENMLHGWRISDQKHMRMSGYPAKTRSLSWSADGHWLATSGADGCIIWPFKDKDGPMAKQPRECGVRRAKVTQVAFHPKALVVAVGYEDGWILLCRLTDAAEILVRRSDDAAHEPITAMAWDAAGAQLLFGTAGGAAGLLTMPA